MKKLCAAFSSRTVSGDKSVEYAHRHAANPAELPYLRCASRKEVGELVSYAMCGSLIRFSDATATVRR